MVFDKMYVQSDILGAALNAASVRNEVITNNIANGDVPGFKAKTVDFEESLTRAVDRRKPSTKLDLSDVKPSVRLVNENYNYRIDENNVDTETEMVNLYQNSIKYEALINCVQSNSKRLTLVLNGR